MILPSPFDVGIRAAWMATTLPDEVGGDQGMTDLLFPVEGNWSFERRDPGVDAQTRARLLRPRRKLCGLHLGPIALASLSRCGKPRDGQRDTKSRIGYTTIACMAGVSARLWSLS